MIETRETISVKEFKEKFSSDTVFEYRVEGMHDKLHSMDFVDFMDDGGDYTISENQAENRKVRYAFPRNDGTVVMYVTGDPRQRMKRYDMPEEVAAAMRDHGWYSWCSSEWKTLFDDLLKRYGQNVIKDRNSSYDESDWF